MPPDCQKFSSDKSRKDWNLSGPFNDYGDVFHMVYDFRNGGTILSAVNSNIWGTGVQGYRSATIWAVRGRTRKCVYSADATEDGTGKR